MSVAGTLGKIHLLPGDVVSRIAAGEIIEHPAAVVKELIDNSVDAGSARITVEVMDGGRGLIKVSDDGEGMSRIDAPIAFQRHATSKLRSEGDLVSIGTMGFRGEALPSIASVSKVRLVTACRSDTVGMQLLLTGGTLTAQEEMAAAPGTLVEVADLFFNTPARRKFLKTTATEFSHICQVAQQAALAWPAIHFRLKHNGHDVLDYPVAASLRDRVLQIYGTRVVNDMAAVRVDRTGIRVEGVTVKALHARASRSPQDLFVNRRPVRNATVSHAVYDGYGASLSKGSHPVFVLFLDVDPARVDVNVHPTKREVRFADQDLIHRTVRQAIRDAVVSDHIAPATTSVVPPRDHQPNDTPTATRESRLRLGHTATGQDSDQPDGGEWAAPVVSEPPPTYLATGNWDVTPLGQISQTFLVAQVGSELQVIDQHTAHERVLFERLTRAWAGQTMPVQPLLIPEPIEVTPHAVPLFQEHLADLARLGLEIEPFGTAAFVIRAVPALLSGIDYTGLVHDLIDDLGHWNSTTSLDVKIRPVMASLACHAAVRAGRIMALPEMKRLIEEWVGEGLPATCPHGRRIALRLSGEELAKMFGR